MTPSRPHLTPSVPPSFPSANSAVAVQPVRTAADRRAFLRLPWKLYAGNPNWVPPLLAEQKRTLDPLRNPFFRHAAIELFLAQKNGETCGRVAAIVDHAHNETHGERTGFFGFFETTNDPEVAGALLEAVREWLGERGIERVRGPVSPSTNYECGLLVDGFDSPPVLMMSFNPPYYATLLEQLGLTKARYLYAYWIEANPRVPEKVRRVAERARRQFGVTVRQANLRDFKAESARIRQIYNEAWQPNWGFVPLAQDEFDFLARSFRPILLPEFILLAEVDGKPVGFVLGLPDMNRVLVRLNGRLFPFGFLKLLWARRRIPFLRVPILGVVPAYQNRGVGALFYLELMDRACALGYEGGEVSWVLEDNAMPNRAAELFGGRRYKTYRIYEGPVARGD